MHPIEPLLQALSTNTMLPKKNRPACNGAAEPAAPSASAL
jgi:hypothetical protein